MTDRHDEPGSVESSWAELADLARETLRRQVELGREYAGLARSAWDSGDPRDFPARTYLESLRREGERYSRELARLGLGYAADVTALGLRAGSAVARDLRGATRGDERSWPTDDPRGGTVTASNAGVPAPAPGIALHGSAGTVAVATITVANRHPRARQIRLAAGSVVDDAGRTVGATVTVAPTRLTVAAGEESTVTLSLEITEGALEVGVDYHSVVEISGGEEATVAVHISRDPD